MPLVACVRCMCSVKSPLRCQARSSLDSGVLPRFPSENGTRCALCAQGARGARARATSSSQRS
eukprot:6203940-Pleurochrysis_carterae.AAC.2